MAHAPDELHGDLAMIDRYGGLKHGLTSELRVNGLPGPRPTILAPPSCVHDCCCSRDGAIGLIGHRLAVRDQNRCRRPRGAPRGNALTLDSGRPRPTGRVRFPSARWVPGLRSLVPEPKRAVRSSLLPGSDAPPPWQRSVCAPC